MSLNISILSGNIGNDPELKIFESGAKKVTFSLATNKNKKDGDDWKTITTWHNIDAWGFLADKIVKAGKGAKLNVKGEACNESWEDSEGNKKYRSFVNADSIDVLQKGKGANSDDSEAHTPVNDLSGSEVTDTGEQETGDLPF